MEENNWGIGAKIWFGFMFLGQWLGFIDQLTAKPPQNLGLHFLIGLIGTIIYIWLVVGKKKGALICIVVLAIISFIINLLTFPSFMTIIAFLGLIPPFITFLVARNHVE